MYIEKLDEERFMLSAKPCELSLMGLSHNTPREFYIDDSNLFFDLIVLAAIKSGFSIKSRKLTVTREEEINRIRFIVTVERQLTLPAGKLCSVGVHIDFAEDLFSLAQRLRFYSTFESNLCKLRSGYLLTLTLSSNEVNSVKPLLSEYGKFIALSQMDLLKLFEYETVICREKAIENLAK